MLTKSSCQYRKSIIPLVKQWNVFTEPNKNPRKKKTEAKRGPTKHPALWAVEGASANEGWSLSTDALRASSIGFIYHSFSLNCQRLVRVATWVMSSDCLFCQFKSNPFATLTKDRAKQHALIFMEYLEREWQQCSHHCDVWCVFYPSQLI